MFLAVGVTPYEKAWDAHWEYSKMTSFPELCKNFAHVLGNVCIFPRGSSWTFEGREGKHDHANSVAATQSVLVLLIRG